MPTGKPYGILTKPRGVTRYDTVLLLDSLPQTASSSRYTLFPIPESIMRTQSMIYMTHLPRATPCYTTFSLGLHSSDSLSRQSAHSAPYVIGGPGGPIERPTITLIGKLFPGKTWFVLRVNFLRILHRTFPGQWTCMGNPLAHVMCVIYFRFVLREDRRLYGIIPCHAHCRVHSPTRMSVTMAKPSQERIDDLVLRPNRTHVSNHRIRL